MAARSWNRGVFDLSPASPFPSTENDHHCVGGLLVIQVPWPIQYSAWTPMTRTSVRAGLLSSQPRPVSFTGPEQHSFHRRITRLLTQRQRVVSSSSRLLDSRLPGISLLHVWSSAYLRNCPRNQLLFAGDAAQLKDHETAKQRTNSDGLTSDYGAPLNFMKSRLSSCYRYAVVTTRTFWSHRLLGSTRCSIFPGPTRPCVGKLSVEPKKHKRWR
jgi:hypothetical protein